MTADKGYRKLCEVLPDEEDYNFCNVVSSRSSGAQYGPVLTEKPSATSEQFFHGACCDTLHYLVHTVQPEPQATIEMSKT